MPAPANSEKIDDLLKATSRLEENQDRLGKDLDEVKKRVDGVKNKVHELETRIARIEENLKHVKERLDRSDVSERLTRVEEGLKVLQAKLDRGDTRRFDIIKIVISALVASVIGGAVGAGFQWLPKAIEANNTSRGNPAVKR